jgi:acetolactate decarboxylase
MLFFRPVLILTLLYSVILAQSQKDMLTQVSTIDALISGIYDGEVTIGELLRKGNLGIGTFNHLDGEMVVLDGKCYQISSSGKIVAVSDTQKTPFAAVTTFETDTAITITDTLNLEKLEQLIDKLLTNKNLFYAIHISGKFKNTSTRSVPAQKKPYVRLTEAVKNQPVFNLQNIRGSLVGFRCPSYVKGINVPGYHLHFITDDKKSGGHLLSCVIDSVTIQIDRTDSFSVLLPHDSTFASADFSGSSDEALRKVEKR